MHMYDCPKFEGCSAPICPLDGNWKLRSHLDGDRVCHYLTEFSKKAFKPLSRGVPEGELQKAVAEAYSEIIARYTPLKKRLTRSSKNSSYLKSTASMGA